MKKLVFLMLIIMLFIFVLVQKEWMGYGVNIILMENGIIKVVFIWSGFNILIFLLFLINIILKYFFLIRSESINGVLVEIVYFDENRIFMFVKNVIVVGNGLFGWKNVEIVVLLVEGVMFFFLVIVINGIGMVYIDNFIVSEVKLIEKLEMESIILIKIGVLKKIEIIIF